MAIRILLIAAFVAMLVFFLRGGRSAQASAGKRILLVLFVGAAIAAVLYPDELTVVANLLGVGRGADLLLYATVAGLVFSLLVIYAKFKDVEEKVTELARHMAIFESDVASGLSEQPARVEEGQDPARAT